MSPGDVGGASGRYEPCYSTGGDRRSHHEKVASRAARPDMERLATFLHGFPVLCLFLSVLLGTLIGRVHVKGVGFGAVVGTLIAGIFIGILAHPELPDLLRWTFFYLFL